ncbi:MAG TPA: hypothetical protein VKR06_20435 [Ktedonosporobacter sp.]|nr:hypothetical protein [Ktedonosporobacter sp.]
MDINLLANITSFPAGVACLLISLRAFYVYRLSGKDLLSIIGLAMGTIALTVFVGNIGDSHLGGNHFSTEWARAVGSWSGALFIFLSSLVKSHEQVKHLRRWQITTAVVFIILIALMPVLPPLGGPLVSGVINSVRMVIYGCACLRYASLYVSKKTRFSLIVGTAFLVLEVGFGLYMPHLLFPASFVLLSILSAFIRAAGFFTLMIAYSMG